MTRLPLKSSERVGRWTILHRLSKHKQGGNGVVYAVEDDSKCRGALKHLRSPANAKSNKRFSDEIVAMKACSGIPGVMPLLDHYLSPKPSEDDFSYFVAPMAKPLSDCAFDNDIEKVIAICKSLSLTLSLMHEQNISHRDIKPANIFLLGDTPMLGDFGLVDYPEKQAITRSDERVGPAYYIAPEMMENTDAADFFKADVFSLGKVLWTVASGQNYPLPGVHIRSIEAFTVSAWTTHERLHEIDALLERMTQIDPKLRPSMAEVEEQLGAWLKPAKPAQHSGDLAPYRHRLSALTGRHSEAIRLRDEIGTKANRERDQIFKLLLPHLEELAQKMRAANAGRVNIELPAGGNDYFFRKATITTSRDYEVFQCAVTISIDGDAATGMLRSGFNAGFRLTTSPEGPLPDLSADVLAAAGHIITAKARNRGFVDPIEICTWSACDKFPISLPTQTSKLAALAAGLVDCHSAAFDVFIRKLEELSRPLKPVTIFKILIRETIYMLSISDVRHLEGITAARKNSEHTFSDNSEYVQFILEDWSKNNDVSQESLQQTLDRAVESYCRQFL